MHFVNIHQAKTHLSKYLEIVKNNSDEVFVICNNGTPIGQLIAYSKPKKKVLGLLKGKIKISDDFDTPLPEEMMRKFK